MTFVGAIAMQSRRKWYFSAIIALFFLAGPAGPVAASPVTVDFTGAVDLFNYGPLTPSTPLYGHIVLDDTVVATGPNNSFDNVILSFSMTVQESGGDVVFTGSGGRVQQFSNSAGTTDFISLGLGGLAGGTITGSAGGLDATSFGLDLRGPDLFVDPTILATGLTTSDFTYRYLTLHFNATGVAGLMVERSLDTLTFSGIRQTASIPAPPAAALLVLAIAGLAAGRRPFQRA